MTAQAENIPITGFLDSTRTENRHVRFGVKSRSLLFEGHNFFLKETGHCQLQR